LPFFWEAWAKWGVALGLEVSNTSHRRQARRRQGLLEEKTFILVKDFGFMRVRPTGAPSGAGRRGVAVSVSLPVFGSGARGILHRISSLRAGAGAAMPVSPISNKIPQ